MVYSISNYVIHDHVTLINHVNPTQSINPLAAKLPYVNFHPLEVVGRGKVGENYSHLFLIRDRTSANLDV